MRGRVPLRPLKAFMAWCLEKDASFTLLSQRLVCVWVLSQGQSESLEVNSNQTLHCVYSAEASNTYLLRTITSKRPTISTLH
jgi:hypothetical protein